MNVSIDMASKVVACAAVMCVSASAFATLSSCWIARKVKCCQSFSIPCSKDGASWTCNHTSSVPQGVSVWAAYGANPGEQGFTQLGQSTPSESGGCVITSSSCGPTIGSCVLGTSTTIICNDVNLDGDFCWR
jgi:hypothetical protein